MTSAARFKWWKAVALVLLVGQSPALVLWRAATPNPAPVHLVIACFEIPIAILIALLATTPADAIRLPPPLSRWIILGGTVCLVMLALVVHRHTPPVVAGGVTIAGSAAGIFLLQRLRVSPWWVVPVAWNPALLAFLAGVLTR